ncbi:MAG: hypothetical protein COA42_08375 [Alteromonadaceae bacterium]|nr:MAG: hypothetical protein COA42_08375 [Alteromonadaceae bacterium]
MPVFRLFTLYINSPRRRFWVLQIALWTWYFLIVLVSLVVARGAEKFYLGVLHLLSETVSGLLLAVLLWVVFNRIKTDSVIKQATTSFVTVAITAGLWTEYKWVTFRWAMDRVIQLPTVKEFGEWYLFSLSVMSVCLMIYYGVHYHLLLVAEREKHLISQAQSKEAQLKMLRYQLNPHFMLNTMNAISTLILKRDNETAFDMVEKLSEFLSYSLDRDIEEKVTLESEIHALEQFIGIERTRFSDRLRFFVRMDKDVKDALIPSMLLQPLVENSIKYAISRSEFGGSINVSAKSIDNILIIRVTDYGAAANQSEDAEYRQSRGVGLSNTRERLDTHYGDKGRLEFLYNRPAGVTVLIQIPCEFTDESHL